METISFTTKYEVNNEYEVPLDYLKEFLEDEDLRYEDMSKDEIADFISENIQEFEDYIITDPDYSDVEVIVF